MKWRVPQEFRELRELFDSADPTPGRVRAAAYRAPQVVGAWARALSAPLELVSDSADIAATRSGATVGVRRVLTFTMPGRIVELDLIETVPGLCRASGVVISRAGQGVPQGEIVIRHPDGQCVAELDAAGTFVVADVPRGPLSVVFRSAQSDVPAIADWMVC